MAENLEDTIRSRVDRAKLFLKPFDIQDMEYRFRTILQPRLIRLDDAKDALISAISEKCSDLRNKIKLTTAVLEAGSPLAAMEKGFSVVTDSNGNIIRNAAKVKKGEKINIRPLKGEITALVENTKN
jgi:exodeoxyribonuclease VII large subunit